MSAATKDAAYARRALILGARSDIAMACARALAKDGWAVMLAARNADTLDAELQDLTLRAGVPASAHDFDALDLSSFEGFADSIGPLPDLVICAVGFMGEQAESQADPTAAARVMRSNFEGPALVLGVFAERMEKRRTGTIIGISSVAGERGRASNYVYGAAKAGFTAFLSGLRNRLAGQGVHVVTVLPGFVATRMTEGMDLPARLTARPEQVAEAIHAAVARGRDRVHVLPVWALVMAVIKAIPERVFKRMRI